MPSRDISLTRFPTVLNIDTPAVLSFSIKGLLASHAFVLIVYMHAMASATILQLVISRHDYDRHLLLLTRYDCEILLRTRTTLYRPGDFPVFLFQFFLSFFSALTTVCTTISYEDDLAVQLQRHSTTNYTAEIMSTSMNSFLFSFYFLSL